jgi:hypothetical protein
MLPMFVCSSKGQWSDALDPRMHRWELGKNSSQSTETSTRSSLTRVGFSRSLLQVKHRPCWYRSCSSSSATVHCKRARFARFMQLLFMSASDRMRLKSPQTAQGPGHASLIASSSSRKMILSLSSCGPYTDESHQEDSESLAWETGHTLIVRE